jgi:hypothetical protein
VCANKSAQTTALLRTKILAIGVFKGEPLLVCWQLFYAVPTPRAMIHSDYLLCFVSAGERNPQKTNFIAN